MSNNKIYKYLYLRLHFKHSYGYFPNKNSRTLLNKSG